MSTSNGSKTNPFPLQDIKKQWSSKITYLQQTSEYPTGSRTGFHWTYHPTHTNFVWDRTLPKHCWPDRGVLRAADPSCPTDKVATRLYMQVSGRLGAIAGLCLCWGSTRGWKRTPCTLSALQLSSEAKSHQLVCCSCITPSDTALLDMPNVLEDSFICWYRNKWESKFFFPLKSPPRQTVKHLCMDHCYHICLIHDQQSPLPQPK